MTSTAINPSIDQNALLMFQNNFLTLQQQTESRLSGARAIKHYSSMGKAINQARFGKLELVKVNDRNPDKQITDFASDNRQFTKDRYTATVYIDKKLDINELIADPTSEVTSALMYAKNRLTDRVAIAAAIGDVLVGRPDKNPVRVTAEADGVINIDAVSSGLTYQVITEINENFMNNDVDAMMYENTILCVTGTEHTDLMNDNQFINNDYTMYRPVDMGKQEMVSGHKIVKFAGSKTGGIQVPNPIIPEGSTTRKCVVMTPEAIGMASELNSLRVEDAAMKVGSWEVTIDYWIGAMRLEGVRVQTIETALAG